MRAQTHLRIWWLSARIAGAVIYATILGAIRETTGVRRNRLLCRIVDLTDDIEALEREVRDGRA